MPDGFRSAINGIVDRHGLAVAFPQEVIAEAEDWVGAPEIDDPALDDLTHLPFVTIDNTDSRDLDQALHIEREAEKPGYVIRYALADAAHFIRPGSALFAEALRRGASFYLPSLSVPMLPRQLSEGVISLNQGQDRRALVFEMHLDETARCRRTVLVRARVRSVRKLSYGRVQRYYDEPAGSGFGGAELTQSLDLLREIGRLRIADAERRHVVDYNRRELEIRIDPAAQLGFRAISRNRLAVERYNEQVSLLCNVEGARFLERVRGLDWVQAVFRVHHSPPRVRLRRLRDQLRALTEAHGVEPERWLWRWRARSGLAAETLAEYLDRLPRRGRWVGLARAVERQVLLTNVRSLFSAEPGAHHGVGAPVYARFSSPMREIVGVFTHKEALEALSGRDAAAASDTDLVLRDEVVDAGNRCKTIQGQITKQAHGLVLDAIFRSELELAPGGRPWRPGSVLGMKPTTVYVELDDPPVEVKLYLSELEAHYGDALRVDRLGVTVRRRSGRGDAVLRLGDRLRLRVDSWHESRERWLFAIMH